MLATNAGSVEMHNASTHYLRKECATLSSRLIGSYKGQRRNGYVCISQLFAISMLCVLERLTNLGRTGSLERRAHVGRANRWRRNAFHTAPPAELMFALAQGFDMRTCALVRHEGPGRGRRDTWI